MTTNETVPYDEQSTSIESKIRKSELYKQLEKKMEELEYQLNNIKSNRIVSEVCPKNKKNYIVCYRQWKMRKLICA